MLRFVVTVFSAPRQARMFTPGDHEPQYTDLNRQPPGAESTPVRPPLFVLLQPATPRVEPFLATHATALVCHRPEQGGWEPLLEIECNAARFASCRSAPSFKNRSPRAGFHWCPPPKAACRPVCKPGSGPRNARRPFCGHPRRLILKCWPCAGPLRAFPNNHERKRMGGRRQARFRIENGINPTREARSPYSFSFCPLFKPRLLRMNSTVSLR
jgi:hypothetical protein